MLYSGYHIFNNWYIAYTISFNVCLIQGEKMPDLPSTPPQPATMRVRLAFILLFEGDD
jgi:hypothetical protein